MVLGETPIVGQDLVVDSIETVYEVESLRFFILIYQCYDMRCVLIGSRNSLLLLFWRAQGRQQNYQ